MGCRSNKVAGCLQWSVTNAFVGSHAWICGDWCWLLCFEGSDFFNS